MNYRVSPSQTNVQNVITPEELNQVIEAIADGRYSWACVLILRFIGYNPLHYIPQRTYSRLMKENSQVVTTSTSTNKQQLHTVNSTHCIGSSQAFSNN
ncbi:HetP family heterocyst commitment protein [Anabaena cylindrica FACHB-243]|uniref:Heterocyst formation protein HetP-like protein n=1 Tax=Anabaena cylindrica (strain ATCC 27899 / PCC 7122) TaxID=272123 RepID=K9ZK59_ANACC|nr:MULTISPECIES: HetP family heterocyst commitment protein [Anabaena]AFZ59596.1 heterocyst formation protein HetP-like protein [Anabaena cylindrica PCC 7122]MBD2418740.1 HetP family heterocyst commitment protein [Anabaena cylindrica FACHB-243]MBY5281633.1 HetP family heterocyst commitment protein [Anabaena sp. CCAP 1446/1C]MBY5309159.1 HetP family heterocyst commitment protein [Anabaena sp. CCAP 1446/1C]MCM2406304.1 HetP family heterocyst commitment protein [Anabaena sp. CCAP 1446/1C]